MRRFVDGADVRPNSAAIGRGLHQELDIVVQNRSDRSVGLGVETIIDDTIVKRKRIIGSDRPVSWNFNKIIGRELKHVFCQNERRRVVLIRDEGAEIGRPILRELAILKVLFERQRPFEIVDGENGRVVGGVLVAGEDRPSLDRAPEWRLGGWTSRAHVARAPTP